MSSVDESSSEGHKIPFDFNFTEDSSFDSVSTPRRNISFKDFDFDLISSFPSHEAFSKNVQYCLISFYCLATFLSLVGNITVIIVLSCGKRTSIRGYLINLAVSDLTMASFCIPFSYTNFMFNHWIFWPEFCGIVMFLQHVSVTSSVYTLVAIGVDRYKALVYPLNERWTKTRAPIVIATIWTFSILVSMVQLIVSYSKQMEWSGKKYYICQENWPYTRHAVYEKVYTMVVFVVTFGLPVVSLSYTYVSIVAMMWSYRLPGNAEPNRDQQRLQAKIKVINMLITVMVCFVLCWFPLHIIQIIVYFAPKLVQCRGQDGCFVYYVSFFACHWIAMSNSFMNPIIYCFMSKNFRNDFIHILVKCRQSRLRRSPSEGRSRSDVGSSFRSILYITHRTSVESNSRTSLKSRLAAQRGFKDSVEMRLVTNKNSKSGQVYEGNGGIPHHDPPPSQVYIDEENKKSSRNIKANNFKSSCSPSFSEDNLV